MVFLDGYDPEVTEAGSWRTSAITRISTEIKMGDVLRNISGDVFREIADIW